MANTNKPEVQTTGNTVKKATKKVKPYESVEVTYTDKAKHHKAGDKSRVHPESGKKLKEKGFATITGEVEESTPTHNGTEALPKSKQ
jgi:hypothetical protein